MVAVATAFSAYAAVHPTSTPAHFFCSGRPQWHHGGGSAEVRGHLAWRRPDPPPRTAPVVRSSISALFGAPASREGDESEVEASPPAALASPPVRVFDGVFHSSACLELVDLAEEHASRATNSDGSSIFYRRPPPSTSDDDGDDEPFPLAPLERAVDSVLTALGDDSPWVEYWSRSEHLNMDAHADIDEELLEDGDELTGEKTLRCPTTGHVLYLDVEEDVRGPTCVFPDRLVGWNGNGDGRGSNDRVSLVTVPAVRGRLLRFDGRAMHAVPRPADRWLLPDDEERELRLEEEAERADQFASADDGDFFDDEDEENDWLDDDDDDDEGGNDPIRSVLLFNTWTDDPPRGVDRDPGTGAPPSGIEIVDDESTEETDSDDLSVSWHIACNAASKWNEVSIEKGRDHGQQDNPESDERLPVRVNLMGSRERRVHPKKFARLLGPGDSIRNALLDPLKPSFFTLTGSNDSC